MNTDHIKAGLKELAKRRAEGTATCECDEQDENVCAHAPDPCFAPATELVTVDGQADEKGNSIGIPTCGDCSRAHGV